MCCVALYRLLRRCVGALQCEQVFRFGLGFLLPQGCRLYFWLGTLGLQIDVVSCSRLVELPQYLTVAGLPI